MIKFLRNHTLISDGAVFRGLRLIPESVLTTDLHNWKGILRIKVVFRKKKLTNNKIYVVIHNSYQGYYHWLLESLPKLLEVKSELQKFTLLLPATYEEGFYIDTLNLIGISNIERLETGVCYNIPQLALPHFAERMGSYSAIRLHQLKDTILASVSNLNKACGASRLYISRQKANRRKVANEPDVEILVSNYGFKIISFEDYNFEEQVRLCASATAMIGIHGAGLSNIVFMPSHAKVVEFRMFDQGVNCFFSSLAHTLNHDYHLLYCEAIDDRKSVQDADLIVNIEKLKKLLDTIFVD